MRVITCPECGRRLKRYRKYAYPAFVPRHMDPDTEKNCPGSKQFCVEDLPKPKPAGAKS